MATFWTCILHLIVTILTLPLYIVIIFAILRKTTVSQFDILLLSQGAADISAMLLFDFFGCLRKTKTFRDIFWNSRRLLGSMMFGAENCSTYARCIGITLISLHKYVTIVQCRTKLEKLLDEIPSFMLVLLQWCVALVMVAPMLSSFDVTFNKKDMELVIPQHLAALANLISFHSAMVLFLISLFCYIQLIHVSRASINRVKRQETRHAIQITAPVFGLLLVFIYNIGQHFLRQIAWDTLLFSWTEMFPLNNLVMSCASVWTYFFFNTELRRRVMALLTIRRQKSAVAGVDGGYF